MSGLGAALQVLADTSFWMAAIALTAPLLYAATGAMLCGQAGVLTLGIEGIVTSGAFVALLSTRAGTAHWTALVIAASTGTLLGLASGILTSPLRLPQRSTGLAITLLAAGTCQLAYGIVFATAATPPSIVPFSSIDLSWIPYISAIPDLPYVSEFGRALFHATSPVYLALITALAIGLVIKHTPLGLALRACGENPAAIKAQGRSVHRLRVGASIVGSTLMAMGGGTLALTSSDVFSFSLLSGRGFAALMLTMLAGWRIGRTFLAVLAFAMVDAYQLHLQHRLGDPLALTLSPLLPYAIALVVLVATSRSTMRRFPLSAD
jgi:simple sugar transport system permease protein